MSLISLIKKLQFTEQSLKGISIYSIANLDMLASLMPVERSSHTERVIHIKNKQNSWKHRIFALIARPPPELFKSEQHLHSGL